MGNFWIDLESDKKDKPQPSGMGIPMGAPGISGGGPPTLTTVIRELSLGVLDPQNNQISQHQIQHSPHTGSCITGTLCIGGIPIQNFFIDPNDQVTMSRSYLNGFPVRATNFAIAIVIDRQLKVFYIQWNAPPVFSHLPFYSGLGLKLELFVDYVY